jgi:hypothetical protein
VQPAVQTRPPAPVEFSTTPWFARVPLGLVLGAANLGLLLMVGRPYHQNWYVALCAAGLLLFAAWLLLEVLRRDWAAHVLICALATVTLANFNIWAFSHLCNLMVFIGLYFFTLFGLIHGAVIGRLVQACGYSSRRAGLALVVAAVIVTWSGGLALEAAYLPGDAAQSGYLERLRRIPPGETAQSTRERVSQHTVTFLAERYPPGGVIGYARWSLASGEISFDVPGRDQPLIYRRPQRRGWFLTRLLLSLALLSFGVGAGLFARRRGSPEPESPSS